MSKFCIAVVKDVRSSVSFCKQILSVAQRSNLGVSFGLDYFEPFLDEFCKSTDLICNISDGAETKNCEHLLLPDNCMVNGLPNIEPFREKMKRLHTVLQCMLGYTTEISLFIGDSGAQLHEFLEKSITIHDFMNASEFLNCIFQPDVHFIIRTA